MNGMELRLAGFVVDGSSPGCDTLRSWPKGRGHPPAGSVPALVARQARADTNVRSHNVQGVSARAATRAPDAVLDREAAPRLEPELHRQVALALTSDPALCR